MSVHLSVSYFLTKFKVCWKVISKLPLWLISQAKSKIDYFKTKFKINFKMNRINSNQHIQTIAILIFYALWNLIWYQTEIMTKALVTFKDHFWIFCRNIPKHILCMLFNHNILYLIQIWYIWPLWSYNFISKGDYFVPLVSILFSLLYP